MWVATQPFWFLVFFNFFWHKNNRPKPQWHSGTRDHGWSLLLLILRSFSCCNFFQMVFWPRSFNMGWWIPVYVRFVGVVAAAASVVFEVVAIIRMFCLFLLRAHSLLVPCSGTTSTTCSGFPLPSICCFNINLWTAGFIHSAVGGAIGVIIFAHET